MKIQVTMAMIGISTELVILSNIPSHPAPWENGPISIMSGPNPSTVMTPSTISMMLEIIMDCFLLAFFISTNTETTVSKSETAEVNAANRTSR